MQRRAVTFAGRVQGVGFRATARQIARDFAVTGWVRNEPDGSVRLEVQGDHHAVDAYLARVGETFARNIERTDATVIPVREDEDAFIIAR